MFFTENLSEFSLPDLQKPETGNYLASCYLLTLASAHSCKTWWDLVQTEYSYQGLRHDPQLLSFQGDNFISKVAIDKKFDDLNTKWFCKQSVDATGTNGRTQDVIHLQGLNGKLLTAFFSASEANRGRRKPPNKGKSRFFSASADEEQDSYDDDFYRYYQFHQAFPVSFDVHALATSLTSARLLLETDNAQITQLIEAPTHQQEPQLPEPSKRSKIKPGEASAE